MVRNLAVSGRRKVPNRNAYIDVEPEIIEHDNVLRQTGLSHEQLVDVGILIGTDFNPGGFAGIGPKTALKLVKESGRLESIDKIRDQLQTIPYHEIREIFLRPEVPNIDKIDFGTVDREKVLDYLCVQKVSRRTGSPARLTGCRKHRKAGASRLRSGLGKPR